MLLGQLNHQEGLEGRAVANEDRDVREEEDSSQHAAVAEPAMADFFLFLNLICLTQREKRLWICICLSVICHKAIEIYAPRCQLRQYKPFSWETEKYFKSNRSAVCPLRQKLTVIY